MPKPSDSLRSLLLTFLGSLVALFACETIPLPVSHADEVKPAAVTERAEEAPALYLAGTLVPSGNVALDDEVREIIRLAAKQGACRSSDDCRILSIEPKPCGGYFAALTASELEGELEAGALPLSARIEAYNAKKAEFQRSDGLVSDCSYWFPPNPECSPAGRCVFSGGE